MTDQQKEDVLRLHFVEHLSQQKIADRVGIARRTVRSVIKGRRTLAAPRAPRVSQLDSFDAAVKKELERVPSMNAPAMLERLRGLGYTGGISVLRDRMRVLRPKPHIEVFSHFEDVRPAQRLEVDWAELGYVLPGVLRRVSAFVAVLVYSRMLFVTFSLSHAMGPFLRCMDRALRFFGGRASVDVFDNMKTVVSDRVRGEPILHPTMVEYARVRGFAVSATKPRHPTGKPFVERGIGFLRSRFLPGVRYSDLTTLKRDGTVWQDTFANAREHEATGKVPSLVFENTERLALAPLRDVHFDTDDVVPTSVGRTHEVGFDRNQYTVPWRLAGQRVLVRADDQRVRVLLGPNEVATHARSWGVGEIVADRRHEEGMREERRRARAGELPDALGPLGAVGAKYFAILAASRRSLRLEEQRLVLLAELFGATATASAVDEVMKTGHVGAEYVEHVMRHKRRLVPAPAPLRLGKPDLDALVVREPDLALYDEICAHRTKDPGESPDLGPGGGDA
ncbi:MAG: IS21 family transposase [Chloroflexota bacterium]